MKVEVAYDTTVFIQKSIHEVQVTVLIAMVLVMLVIFLFLRSWRAVLVPLVTIPFSLIGAFGVMYLFGFTINTLSLLAMVLAIGLVVDDAIVMLENIFRNVENGMEPMAAAFKGSKEIGFAIVAMSLTLAAVYVPFAFQTGRTGKLFVEFALTLAGAVVIFRLRGADAVADDELAPAAPREQARRLLPVRRARAGGAGRGVQAAAGRRAVDALGGGRGDGAAAGRRLGPAEAAAE
jgi:hypothetical protein